MSVSNLQLVVAYFVGGLTFFPLCLILILAHAYASFPTRSEITKRHPQHNIGIREAGDDDKSLLSDRPGENLLEKFQAGHEHDVAAGYFAVCREYVPGGVNGKPPERVTPAGTIAATESPSVYQSMYRSIFDRKLTPTLDTGRAEGKPLKRANNVFFIVLRHGHLMLYENSEQFEVRHVIPLEHHRISIYAGGEDISEGELWIKRNAIQLRRRTRDGSDSTKPFFLFSENCSDKEDFYFAMLEQQQQQERRMDNQPLSDGAPQPLEYDSKHIIGLVQRLHSSEEQLQTRWINGLAGRLFLALYKTSDVEDFIRQKITKKISRVQKPAFLTGIVLRKIDVGNSAPQITNPKLRELTIHGDCSAEATIRYDGNFKIEVAATARLDLGARFRARQVDLVLAVVVKKLTGLLLVKFKPPPSNRLWISFERMPEMDLSIEPIVSSRQITYGIILRAIQSRIREVIAETVVLPHWDDIPFGDSSNHPYRGGIWTDQQKPSSSSTTETRIPDDAASDLVGLEVSSEPSTTADSINEEQHEKEPVVAHLEEDAIRPGESTPVLSSGADQVQNSGLRPKRPPKALRSTSLAAVADPLLSNANADYVLQDSDKIVKRDKDATSSMMAISLRSKADADVVPSRVAAADPTNSITGVEAKEPLSGNPANVANRGQPQTKASKHSDWPSETSSITDSQKSDKTAFSKPSIADGDKLNTRFQAASKVNKKSMATIGAAGAAAKKWGWGVLSRASDQDVKDGSPASPRMGTPSNPIGRGQPLPPVGEPLPSPNGQRASSMPLSIPPKRPPAPQSQSRRQEPERGARRRQSSQATRCAEATDNDGILVVEAPMEDLVKVDTDGDLIPREEPVGNDPSSIGDETKRTRHPTSSTVASSQTPGDPSF